MTTMIMDKKTTAITCDNIHRHELVGLHATVIQSTHLRLVGTFGRIVDETKQMLFLRGDSGRVVCIPKATTVLRCTHGQKSCVVDGLALARRSEDRLVAE